MQAAVWPESNASSGGNPAMQAATEYWQRGEYRHPGGR